MISDNCEVKLQIHVSLQLTPNMLQQQKQQQQRQHNHLYQHHLDRQYRIITYENFIVRFRTSEEYHLQRVGVKVGGHFLSLVASRSVRVDG